MDMSPQVRLFLGTAALVAVYFAVPVRNDGSLLVRTVLTAAGLAVATALIVREVKHQINRQSAPLWGLALAVIGGVLAFAMADYVIAFTKPGEFDDLSTRLDALYFALTTLATVGYGDVHAVGQIARAAVSIQMVFNLVVLTTAASIIANQMRSRVQH
jgi:hypothetical protein